MNRRRPGQSSISTPRNEEDKAIILSGTENGKTLGTIVTGIIVKNKNIKKEDYQFLNQEEYKLRPSHADLTYILNMVFDVIVEVGVQVLEKQLEESLLVVLLKNI